MHRMKMVVEIIYLILAALEAVQEDLEYFFIRLRLGWKQQRYMI